MNLDANIGARGTSDTLGIMERTTWKNVRS